MRKGSVGGGASCVSGRRSDNVGSTGATLGLISSVQVRQGTRVQGATDKDDGEQWCEWGRGWREVEGARWRGLEGCGDREAEGGKTSERAMEGSSGHVAKGGS